MELQEVVLGSTVIRVFEGSIPQQIASNVDNRTICCALTRRAKAPLSLRFRSEGATRITVEVVGQDDSRRVVDSGDGAVHVIVTDPNNRSIRLSDADGNICIFYPDVADPSKYAKAVRTMIEERHLEAAALGQHLVIDQVSPDRQIARPIHVSRMVPPHTTRLGCLSLRPSLSRSGIHAF